MSQRIGWQASAETSREVPELGVVVTEYDGARARRIAVTLVRETWTAGTGYRVRAMGPVLTSTGKLHATQTAYRQWVQDGETHSRYHDQLIDTMPEALRAALLGPAALRNHLATELTELLLTAVMDQDAGVPVRADGYSPRVYRD